MQYYKYTEVISGRSRIKLDYANYRDYVKEYIVDYTEDNRKIYVCSVELPDDIIPNFLKIQKVSLEVIDKDQFEYEATNSEDYKLQWNNIKATRSSQIANATVTYRGFTFDADESAITRMNEKLTYYNGRFIGLLGAGTSIPEAYSIFNDVVEWKDVTKVFRKITVAELRAIYELAIVNREKCWIENTY